MLIFGKTAERRFRDMEATLQQSFQRVKHDTNTLYQWVRYLNHQNQDLQRQNANLRRETKQLTGTLESVRKQLAGLPSQLTREDVRRIVDAHYSLEPLLQRLRSIDDRITRIEQRRSAPRPALVPRVEPVRKQVSQLREKIVRRVAARSKEYLKSVIMGIITKYGRVSAVQIREMVVEEQGLCSRSSFYRILEELEKDPSVGVFVGKKEKVYVAKAGKARAEK